MIQRQAICKLLGKTQNCISSFLRYSANVPGLCREGLPRQLHLLDWSRRTGHSTWYALSSFNTSTNNLVTNLKHFYHKECLCFFLLRGICRQAYLFLKDCKKIVSKLYIFDCLPKHLGTVLGCFINTLLNFIYSQEYQLVTYDKVAVARSICILIVVLLQLQLIDFQLIWAWRYCFCQRTSQILLTQY